MSELVLSSLCLQILFLIIADVDLKLVGIPAQKKVEQAWGVKIRQYKVMKAVFSSTHSWFFDLGTINM